MRLDDRQKEKMAQLFDVTLERQPFSILVMGIGIILLLKDHLTKQLCIGSAIAATAMVAFYRGRIWPSESFRSKVIWWFVFAIAGLAIILSLGKWFLVLAGMAGAIFIPVLLLIRLYRFWSDKRFKKNL